MKASVSRRSRRALGVPAADGYHFGDDHEWGAEEQNDLIGMLKDARDMLDKEPAPREAPAEDA